FSDWDWTSMSGGWYNRNWDLSPYDQNFTDENLFNCPLHWSPTTKDIPSADSDSSYSDTNTIEEEVSTSVALLGLKTGETYTNEQENTVSSAISQAIDFEWGMIKNESICGVTDLKIEPQLLTPKKQKKPGDYYCPWVPKMFGNYTPWFLTFDVLSVSYNDNCNPSAAAMESKIATNALPKGAGTITLPSGGIPVGTTGQVQAVPASGYRFLHWKGYGVDLEDYSSPVTNATVVSQLSTLRAFFAKQSSDLVDTAMISIQNGSTGNQVKLQGTLPAGFNMQVALHHKTPVEVTVGSLVFPFGFGIGNVTVVSDHEIAYTTEDSANGVSHLRVDFGTNKWWFTADQVQDLSTYGVRSNIVTIGIGGEDVSAEDKILMTGEEGISWSGKNEAVSNDVISLQNATLSGSLNFLNDKSGLSTLALDGGDLKVSSVNSTDPVRFTLNEFEFGFEKPTSESGNLFTYQMTGKDLNATITVNNQTMRWSAELDGERVSHDYIRPGMSIGLMVGDNYGSVSIHPNLIASLKTMNIDSSSFEEEFLS
ncbi:MAG: hypothetical protein LUQ07_08210, partial [Methanospirillum sp.]|nr:hypothetical protein [Methanospirillum sp.]